MESLQLPRHIERRNGTIDLFNPMKIKDAISSAIRAVHIGDESEKANQEIYQGVLNELSKNGRSTPKIDNIQKIVVQTARAQGFPNVASAYEVYSNTRDEVRRRLGIVGSNGDSNSTDTALMIESDSQDTLGGWDRKRIETQLQKETNLAPNYAIRIAKNVENMVLGLVQTGVERLTTTDLRGLVDISLKQEGLDSQVRRQALLGVPTADLEDLIFSKSNENSNVANNNPEAVNLGIAEMVQKPYALNTIFRKAVSDAHFDGAIHVHDLGYPTRVYCSSHSDEYLKKFGLGKVLGNLESKSSPPKSAAVSNQHMQTFLASLQAHYAGALGFGFLNIFYSPLLNRPVKVVKGKFRGKETTLEKRDLEKLVEQNVMSLERDDWDSYFEMTSETTEMKEVSQKEYDQVAQNLIFAASQNAFSRGGQTLFIDFNIHAGVPQYIKEVPAIGPGGNYMVKMPDESVELVKDVPRIKTGNKEDTINGDAYDSGLAGKLKGGHIITYGDLEPSAQKFAKSMLNVWRKGDKDGRPFHFPKCDLHVDKDSFEKPDQEEIINLASQIASENGSVYFMFDRGDGAVLAQCCRLKERIEDPEMLKYPEKLRFTGFQNITINLAQAAYRGKNLEETLGFIDESMNLALQAHFDKKEYMQKLLDTDGSPMRCLGKESDDGTPYIDLKKATYIIGNIGLNEAVESLTGQQLHESESAYRVGLKMIARMYQNIKRFKEETGLKFTIEETPGESTTRRLAMVDKKRFKEQADKVVKGTDKNPYYTNSIHFAPDADVGIIDRIEGQSRYHDMIESGAIVHAWIGEQRPDKDVIKNIIRQTLEGTRCSQLVFSPTYTECDDCGNIMVGEKELCTHSNCDNYSQETLDSATIHTVTRIVGYNSRIDNWNGSQKQIYEDRKKAEKEYAGQGGRDMNWLYSPNGHERLTVIQFAKHDCQPCKKAKTDIEKVIKDLELEVGKDIDYQVHYLDRPTIEGLETAAMYNMPLDTFPSVVIAGKNEHWSKVTKYATKIPKCDDKSCSTARPQERSDFIRRPELKQAIIERLDDYALVPQVQ